MIQESDDRKKLRKLQEFCDEYIKLEAAMTRVHALCSKSHQFVSTQDIIRALNGE